MRSAMRIMSWVERMIKKSLPEDDALSLNGQLYAMYLIMRQDHGLFRARVWLGLELIKSLPGFIAASLYWRFSMMRNYLKIAYRNIKRHKGFSFINIFGLAVGLATVILILIYVQFQMSYDTFHDKGDRIYRVMQETGSRRSSVMPAPLGPTLLADFPEIENSVRFFTTSKVHVSAAGKNFFEEGFGFVDPSVFEMFSFEIISGQARGILDDPFSMVISKSASYKYFGQEDPIGETVIFRGQHHFRVTGLMEDIPPNSHIRLDFIVPFTSIDKIYPHYQMDNWHAFSFRTYCLLKEHATDVGLESKLTDLARRYFHEDLVDKTQLYLQPIHKIHLQEPIMRLVYLFTVLAFLILLIACVNYVNLATARSSQRLKEIALRKVVGAHRPQLIRQFLGESVFYTFFAFSFALMIVALTLPAFSTFVEEPLSMHMSQNPAFIPWLVILFGVVSLAAGLYPAIVISAFRPTALFHTPPGRSRRNRLRTILVIGQFTVSIILIVVTLVIKSQIHFIHERELGFQTDRILVVDIRDHNLRSNITSLQQELLSSPDIGSATASSYLPDQTGAATWVEWPGMPAENRQETYVNWVDYGFLETYRIPLVQGRNFSKALASDADGAFILNETAVRVLGLESPLGRKLTHRMGGRTGTIIGIVKDFHMLSLREQIQPLILDLHPGNADTYLSIEVKGENLTEVIDFVRMKISAFSPNYPFAYSFYEDVFDDAYRIESKVNSLFSLFSALAICIACLGLFGLASFSADRRTKEIGIRKVLGASEINLVCSMIRQFTIWVLVANGIAWPIAWFGIRKLLQFYAYRIQLGVGYFLISAMIVLFLAVLTTAYQALTSARTDPVESLKYE